MNKDLDNKNNTKEAVNKALDIMENPAAFSEKQLQEMLEDKECLQSCRDIMDSSLLLRQKVGMEHPDIEMELRRFKEKQHSSAIRSIRWKIMIGIAAMTALLLGSYYFIDMLSHPTLEPVTIFTADTTPQHIVLQKENGEEIVLDELKTGNPPIPLQATTAKAEKKELDYRRDLSNTVQTHKIIVPRGENFKIVLCDGTEVWLNANSNFVYPTSFVGDERIVSLDGEAYFKVAKDARHPFIVKTKNIQTKVLGTEFNVRSYSPEDTHIVLVNGKVEVCNTQGGAYTSLNPGEDAHLQPDGNFILSEVDLDSYVYWKDGFFYFDDTTLKDIMLNLGRWYNVNIEFRNQEAMNYKMHFASNRNKGIEHTISLLNRLKKVTVTLHQNTLTID